MGLVCLIISTFKLILYFVVAAVGRLLLDWEQLDWCSWLFAYIVNVGFIVIDYMLSGLISRNSGMKWSVELPSIGWFCIISFRLWILFRKARVADKWFAELPLIGWFCTISSSFLNRSRKARDMSLQSVKHAAKLLGINVKKNWKCAHLFLAIFVPVKPNTFASRLARHSRMMDIKTSLRDQGSEACSATSGTQ